MFLHVQDAAVAQSALAGVHTLQDGTGDRQTALGNLYVAAKISPKAVSPKSFQGESCGQECTLHAARVQMAKHCWGYPLSWCIKCCPGLKALLVLDATNRARSGACTCPESRRGAGTKSPIGLQDWQGPACQTARRSTLASIPMLSSKAHQQQHGRLRLQQLPQSLLRPPLPHLSRYDSAARQCTLIPKLMCPANRRLKAAHPAWKDLPLHLATQ